MSLKSIRNEKQNFKLMLSEVQDSAKKSELQKCWNLLKKIGIKLEDVSFSLNDPEANSDVDVFVYYPKTAHETENVMMTVKMVDDTSLEAMKSLNLYLFNQYPNLGFIMVRANNTSRFFYRVVSDNSVAYYYSDKNPNFAV